MSVCFKYSACISHHICFISNCHLWPVWLYHNFPHYLLKGTIFGKKLWNVKCVFVFSLLHVPDTVLILRHIEQDNVIKFNEILPSVYIGLNVKYALLLPDFT